MRNNPYDYKYVMRRDECTEDKALLTVANLKNKTSGSLKSFIKRYGKEEGEIKYQEFCERSANTKDKFRLKYGDEWNNKWEEYLKSKDSVSLSFHIKKYGEELGIEKYNERLNKIKQDKETFIKRYGKEGEIKYQECQNKKSYSCSFDGLAQKHGNEYAAQVSHKKRRTGKSNGMYGKPSPQGSGNGWSGWYKDVFFRSLLELSYIHYLIENDIEFENGELSQYKIEYKVNNIKRNYFCDFYLINEDKYIEIKPKNLVNSSLNRLKFKAAIDKHKNKFSVLTEDNFPQLSSNDIDKLYSNGNLIFMKRYDEKYKQRKINED